MITLNYRDARPIYEQVRDGLRRLIVSGAIADGEKLPSVRALASQLAINPNTIQRAYSELESEGYAVSVPGKGSFAVRRERAENDGRRLALTETLRETLRELRALGGRMAARGTAPAAHRLAVGAAVRTAPAALQRRARAARRKIFLLHFLSRALSPFAAAREMDRYSPCIRKARSLLLRAFSSYSDTGSYSRPAAKRAIISLVRATPLSR